MPVSRKKEWIENEQKYQPRGASHGFFRETVASAKTANPRIE